MTKIFTPLVIDTETDGLWEFGPDAHTQNVHVLQLAAKLYAHDGTALAEMNRFVRPDGFSIDENNPAIKVNGLTYEKLMDEGLPIVQILEEYDALVDSCDLIVGFNVAFDQKGVRAEQRRNDRPDRYGERDTFDCMYTAKKITSRMEGEARKAKTLSAVYRAIFEQEGLGAHGAMGDVTMTAALYHFMLEQDMVKPKKQIDRKSKNTEG